MYVARGVKEGGVAKEGETRVRGHPESQIQNAGWFSDEKERRRKMKEIVM